MIKDILKPKTISDYLKNNYDESISHTAINNYIYKVSNILLNI